MGFYSQSYKDLIFQYMCRTLYKEYHIQFCSSGNSIFLFVLCVVPPCLFFCYYFSLYVYYHFI